MLSYLYALPSSYKAVVIDPYFNVLNPVDSVDNGVLVKRSEVKAFSLKDVYDGFSIYDFSIANILQTGATNMLKPVTLVNPDVAGITIKMDNFLNNGSDEKAS